MKIVADDNIPGLDEYFGQIGEIHRCPASAMTSPIVAGADILLVRSVTRVDESLLAASTVRFVGSATAGTDHIDLDYLRARDISFAHAPGCNANAVVQYVIAALCRRVPDWRGYTVGIVGCGNVGRRLTRALLSLGVKCRVYDPFVPVAPPAVRAELQQVLACDIITLHVPLTHTGPHSTRHLIDRARLEKFAPNTVLINTSRGAAVDTRALSALLGDGVALRVILDVWEQEPYIDRELLSRVSLATPHIAGHSQEGKWRATQMLAEACCEWLGRPSPTVAEGAVAGITSVLPNVTSLCEAVLRVYDPADDHRAMLEAFDHQPLNHAHSDHADPDARAAAAFENLRRNYRQRREFDHYRVNGIDDASLLADLQTLGFLAADKRAENS